MSTRNPSRPLPLIVLVLALATVGCGLQAGSAAPTVAVAEAVETQAAAPTVPATQIPASPTAQPSPTEEATIAPAAPVRVTASGGNMTLRRGPATAYDVRGYFLAGQETIAVARNAAADWLLVQDPSQSASTAWVSVGSRYIVLQADAGALQALPVQAVEPAVPAYVRNCTYHPMRVLPADHVLKEQLYPPDNQRAFNPGVYEAFDQSVEGNPKVLSEELREGETIDITTDGLGNTYACPS